MAIIVRMRIVSWNCFRGDCRIRASKLNGLRPDVVLLQECAKPEIPNNDCLWFGSNPTKGVGVIAKNQWTVRAGTISSEVPDSVYPVKITGPISMHLLAVWAMRRPTYVRSILHGLDHYRQFLLSRPSMVVGDFNSHSRWDNQSRKANHSILVERLMREFGLVSAYHAFTERLGNISEAPTHYWQWKSNQPFHLDYCFIPEKWTTVLKTVDIEPYHEWAKESDHRPLTVDLEL